MKKIIATIFVGVLIVCGLLQLIRPGIPEKAASAEVQVPPQIQQILQKSCYDCHSDQARLSWFDHIQPGYSLVRYDILTARQHLNFSTLGSKAPAAQKAALFEAVNMIQLGAMPLRRYTRLHPGAKITLEELETLKTYLAPWSPLSPRPASPNSAAAIPSMSTGAVHDEYNGLAFDPGFKGWNVLSSTDRGDNNTLRFILGNQVAVEAARAGHVSPWPDGTRFAKIAWQQELGEDGFIHPGNFVQIELMVKDSGRYKGTDGWGWGRWRGLDLKPYGQNGHFVDECTGCHMPLRGDDYVYTLPITAATVRDGVVNNRAAQVPANLPYQPLAWHAITLFVDPARLTASTLYGNDAAISKAPGKEYREGSVLALITWAQRDDPHWFGARIPDLPLSIEFVRVMPGGTQVYQNFQGPQWSETTLQPDLVVRRLHFITGLSTVQLP